MQAESEPEEMEENLARFLSPAGLIGKLEKTKGPVFYNEYFFKTLLFLALLFVPSGAVLLWSNPSWETMHEGTYEKIPPWLVAGFNITNVTQGILGYLVTYHLLMKGRYHKAALQTVLAYFGMFFILANGWDKTGYMRFFSASREDFEKWDWSNLRGWLASDVVKILLSFGVAFIPLLYYWVIRWLMEGYDLEEGEGAETKPSKRRRTAARLAASFSTAVFGGALGSAVVATLLIRYLGWLKGLLAFGAGFYGMILSKRGPGAWLVRKIMRVDSLDAPAVWEINRAGD
jgi:hypothetical protein